MGGAISVDHLRASAAAKEVIPLGVSCNPEPFPTASTSPAVPPARRSRMTRRLRRKPSTTLNHWHSSRPAPDNSSLYRTQGTSPRRSVWSAKVVCDRWVGALAIAASPVPNGPCLAHLCRGVLPSGPKFDARGGTCITHLVTRCWTYRTFRAARQSKGPSSRIAAPSMSCCNGATVARAAPAQGCRSALIISAGQPTVTIFRPTDLYPSVPADNGRGVRVRIEDGCLHWMSVGWAGRGRVRA